MRYAGIIFALLYLSGCIPAPVYHAVKKENEKSNRFPGKRDTTALSTTLVDSNKAVAASWAISKDQQEAMMQEIRSWMGTPYRFGMVEKGKGTDCSGFVGYVFKKVLNLELPRIASDIYARGEILEQKDLQFGDLVFFENTYKGAKGASHVSIYVGQNRIAHASTTVGVTISELSENYYAKHYLGCRRVVK
jgi:cell wall-associated NlpC family hydrolase